MTDVKRLLDAYRKHISLPWRVGLSGQEKCLFVIYDPDTERAIRKIITQFELETKNAGHKWSLCDVTNTFAQWMPTHKYAERYFSHPELLRPESGLGDLVIEKVRDVLTAADDNTVVAILGAASLFGILSVSEVIAAVDDSIRGRLLVFFAGEHNGARYAPLGADHGWNYHAVPIEVLEFITS